MIELPVFAWVQTPEVKAVLGDDVRVYPFASAPHEADLEYPYCTYTFIAGAPENTLCGTTDTQNQRIQFDAWGITDESSFAAARAVEGALKSHGYVVSYNMRERDSQTKMYRVSFDMEFWHDGY